MARAWVKFTRMRPGRLVTVKLKTIESIDRDDINLVAPIVVATIPIVYPENQYRLGLDLIPGRGAR